MRCWWDRRTAIGVAVFAAADDFVRRLQRAGDEPALPAYGANDGDADLYGSPFVEGERQQRVDGAVDAAGHELREFPGRYIYVGEEHHGVEAVIATERDEPQAVIGSHLHKLAYPEKYEEFVKKGRELDEAHEHPGGTIESLQFRGEYLYAARGKAGVEI